MKKYIFGISFICIVIGIIYFLILGMINRTGTAYVEYEIIYPDSTIQYTDTVNFVYCNADVGRFKRFNLKPIKITSYKGSNYINVYDYKVVQNTCPIRLKTSKIINYSK